MNVLGSSECSLAVNFASPLTVKADDRDYIVCPLRLRDLAEAENIVRSRRLETSGELDAIWGKGKRDAAVADAFIGIGDILADDEATRWLSFRSLRLNNPALSMGEWLAMDRISRNVLMDAAVRLSGMKPEGDDDAGDDGGVPVNWQKSNAMICHFFPAYSLDRVADLTWPQYVGLMGQIPELVKLAEK